MSQKVVVIAEIKQMLLDGMSRKEIQQQEGFNTNEMKEVFSHPDLKGVKTRKKKESRLIIVTSREEIPQEESEVVTSTEEEITGESDIPEVAPQENVESQWAN